VVLDAARTGGLEGVVAKRADSPYRPGRRSTEWIKVKNTTAQEVVIGGWATGRGARSGTVGSLLLGIPGPDGDRDGDGLAYVGRVGTGFSEAVLRDLLGRLTRLERRTSPFSSSTPVPTVAGSTVHWVRPSLVGEVEYREWTREGRLRHPTWRGLRDDKDPSEVRRES
jgi:bifunctional non-homologous end joining protein LigD